jgi:excisionase family DNA binding protein
LQLREPNLVAALTPADAATAEAAGRHLAAALPDRPAVQLKVSDGNGAAEAVTVPTAALRLLVSALREMGKGNPVSLVPIPNELTAEGAAELLLVSTPFVTKLLDEGKLPFRTVGGQRKVLFNDLMEYKTRDDAERRKIADELAAEAQELGLY